MERLYFNLFGKVELLIKVGLHVCLSILQKIKFLTLLTHLTKNQRDYNFGVRITNHFR